MMKKIIFRVTILYIMIGHLIVFFIAPYSSKGLDVFQAKDWLLLIWGTLYILSIFFMWGYFFYHWGCSKFNNSNVKRVWFWVILVGGILYFIGPLIYYIVVYERQKGLERES